MKRRICFFTIGFAFNRLVRMKYYEKIFPKNIELFLFTTDKYKGKEKEKYQQEYAGLKRTKVFYANYNPLTLPFTLRKFCQKNNIDRLMNIGAYYSAVILFLSTFSTSIDYILNIFSDIFNQYKITEKKRDSLLSLLIILYLFPFIHLAKKINFTDKVNSKRAPVIFLYPKNKINHLAAPVNTDLFKHKSKLNARKKLKFSKNNKIIISVGRVNYLKCSDILKEAIKMNPDIYFIIIGRLLDKDFLEMKNKYRNFELINKKSSKELIDYYNASDLSFCVNRGGGGIGLVTEEALACGVPVVVSKAFRLKKSKALFQVPLNSKLVDKSIKEFFSLSQKQRKEISKIAQNYVKNNYSDNVWKNKYINSYLT